MSRIPAVTLPAGIGDIIAEAARRPSAGDMTIKTAGCIMKRTMDNRGLIAPGTEDIPRPLLTLARICIPGTYLVLVVSFAVMIGIGAGFIYGLWYVINRWLPEVHGAVILIPGAVFLAGIVFAVAGTIRSFRAGPQFAPALLIDLDAEPGLKTLLRETSTIVKTRPPDSVVLHADANFFVQQGTLVVFNGEARGRVLAMSLPLLSFVSVSELRAILAHELAHFTGNDEPFSATVIPAYTRLARNIEAMSVILGAASPGSGPRKNPGWMGVPLIFPWFLLNLYWTLFHRINIRASRIRERRADVVAAVACGSPSLVSALRKVAALRRLFPDIFKKTFADRVRWGLTLPNYCQLFRDAVPGLDEAIRALGDTPPGGAEPEESHPPLEERFAYIPVITERFPDDGPAAQVLAIHRYEEQMTDYLMKSIAIQSPPATGQPPSEELPEAPTLYTDENNIPDPAYTGETDDNQDAPDIDQQREENHLP